MQGNAEYDTQLTPKQTADILRVSPDTLWRWRAHKVGPPWYRKVGRIFYFETEVRAWERSNPGQIDAA